MKEYHFLKYYKTCCYLFQAIEKEEREIVNVVVENSAIRPSSPQKEKGKVIES